MTAPREVSFNDYMVKSMKDPIAAAYVVAVIELDDPAALLVALRHVAKAHGMAEVARRADVGEKTLFKALTFMQRVSSTPDHERNYGVCRRSEAEVVKIFDGIDREI